MTADLLPVAVLAACLWTYWVGAMRMVVRVRRKSRQRTAGLVPRQPLERALWALWVPAVLAWLALPVAALASSVDCEPKGRISYRLEIVVRFVSRGLEAERDPRQA